MFIHLRKGKYPKVFTNGMAYDKVDYIELLEYNLPFRISGKIELDVSSELCYPVITQHRKRTGRVKINNWQEELVLLLGHEMRHLNQFWYPEIAKQREVDAENYGIMMLREYRESLNPLNLDGYVINEWGEIIETPFQGELIHA